MVGQRPIKDELHRPGAPVFDEYPSQMGFFVSQYVLCVCVISFVYPGPITNPLPSDCFPILASAKRGSFSFPGHDGADARDAPKKRCGTSTGLRPTVSVEYTEAVDICRGLVSDTQMLHGTGAGTNPGACPVYIPDMERVRGNVSTSEDWT